MPSPRADFALLLAALSLTEIIVAALFLVLVLTILREAGRQP